MKNFIDDSSSQGNTNEIMFRTTPSYIELEIINEDVSFYVYLIPRAENSFFVTTCWGDSFDDLLSELDEDSLEIMADTWGTFTQLLLNGINDKYQEGALIKLEDSDFGEAKWFIATIAGNVHIHDDVDEFLGQDRIQTAIQLVIQRSMEVTTELNENKPRTGKYIWKGIKRGVGVGLAAGILGALGIPPIDFK